MEPLKHFYLFCCEIAFVNSEGSAGVTRTSTVVQAPDQRVTVRELAQAQQGCQMVLFRMLGEEVNVMNVVIMSVSYLGEMSEDEFNAKAEGPTVVSKEPGEASNDG